MFYRQSVFIVMIYDLCGSFFAVTIHRRFTLDEISRIEAGNSNFLVYIFIKIALTRTNVRIIIRTDVQ